VSHWTAAWASETVGISREAFAGLSFGAEEYIDVHRQMWPVTEPANYSSHRAALQQEQLVRAGARLAQLLENIYP
jgi:hypothetical protein